MAILIHLCIISDLFEKQCCVATIKTTRPVRPNVFTTVPTFIESLTIPGLEQCCQ